MVGWHHWLNGHEFGQTLGVGDGQESLACCRPWGCKELDTTEWLNWYLNGLVVFPTFFNLSLNFATPNSWSEPQSAPQGICPVVGLLGHMVVLFLVFKGISILFSIVVASIYIPTLFSTLSPAFIDCRFFCLCEMVPHCHFDLHFSDNEWCWASFSCVC